jgi:hypothetical protein
VTTESTIELGTRSVAKWPLQFKPWRGAPIADTYGRKPVLDWYGEAVFAEIAIVRVLQSEGFDAVWIDGYRHRFMQSISEKRDLPEPAKILLDRVISFNDGQRKGCWDVLAWKGENYLFVEVKRKGKDRISPEQIRWLEAALQAGMDISCFRICEWDIAKASHIEELKTVIHKLHGAEATHRESVPVKDIFNGQTVWDGIVEVFDLHGHAKANKVYAWSHATDDPDNPKRYVTVLHIPPAISPQTAVKVAILQEYKSRAAAQA